MKSKIAIFPKNNDFVGQFKTLNTNEMSNLRGGVKPLPPLPPPPGEDLPIILTTMSGGGATLGVSSQPLPVLNSQPTINAPLSL